MDTSQPIREKIVMELDASGVKPTSLAGLIQQLEQVHTHVQKVNAALNGVKLGPSAARSVRELEATIKQLQIRSGTTLKTADLSKALGIDQSAFDQFLTRQKKNLKDYQATLQQFRSAPGAARAIARFERESVLTRSKLGDLLRPTVSQVSGAAGPASVSGGIPLVIPAAQIQASVVGPIQLNIPGAQVTGGAGGGGGRNPATGQFVPGGGGGGGGKKGGKGPLSIPPAPGELQRVRTETNKYLRDAVTHVEATGELITTTHDSVEGIIKTSTKKTTGRTPLSQFREARRVVEESFKQLKSGLSLSDPGFGLARLQEKQAAQLRAISKQPFMNQLGAPQAGAVTRLLDEQAKSLEASAKQTLARANLATQEQANRNFAKRVKDQRRILQDEISNSKKERDAALAEIKSGTGTPGRTAPDVYNERARRLRTALGASPLVRPAQAREVEALIRKDLALAAAVPKPPPIPKPKPEPVSKFQRGLTAFTPAGFSANLLNVSGWAAAVGVLYKSIELARYSMERFLSISQQTARLSQVFRGVGGSAREVADDVMALASAQGRDTEEAMHSATEWSRLGLTRTQVNEAVRVSMMAANVADMHSSETTKQLASLMHIYNLEATDLDGVLGMLVNTSQKYNVTLEDLFQGLDRSAGSAKLAGVNLAELQGMIGTVVGKTGQSGVTVGNTLKSLLVQFSNPDVQKYLRAFGLETLTNTGQQKSGSQIMQQLAVRWQSLDTRQQQNLTWRLVGRQQAARFVPLMEDYAQSQKLAIDSQLNLNRAEEANARILGTVKTQLVGVRAEWDRLIVSTMNTRSTFLGGNTPGDTLESIVRAGRNALRAVNRSSAASGVTPASPGPFSLGLFALKQGADLINNVSDTPFDRHQRQFQNQSQQQRSAANAYAMRARLFESVSDMLPGARDLNSQGMRATADAAASEMDKKGAGAFRGAIAGGNVPEAQAILKAQAELAHKQSVDALEMQMAGRQQVYAEGTQRLSALRSEIAAMEEKHAAQDAINAKEHEAVELEGELSRLRSDKYADMIAMQEQEGDVSQVIELQQQYLNLLKEQEQVMGAIDQLAAQQNTGTMGGQMDSQVQAMDQQLAMLRAAQDRLKDRGSSEDIEAGRRIIEQIKEREAQRAAMDSPQMRTLAQTMDARQIAARRASEEAQSFGVGRTEADRLLQEERRLQQELAILRQRSRSGSLTENDAVRGKQMEIDLWNTQEKIQTRIIDLARQERQIRLDANREFQKNLMLAGPGEQLQRLYVSQLMSRRGGISGGEFNALSPEAKQMYYQASGGEQGAINRQEQARLRGRSRSVDQEQDEGFQSRKRIGKWGQRLNEFSRQELGELPPMPLPMEQQAKAAGEQLGLLGDSAAGASKALVELQARVDQLFRDNAQPFATPKLGISTGFALGVQTGSAIGQ